MKDKKEFYKKLNIKTCAINNCAKSPINDKYYTIFIDIVCKKHHDEWANNSYYMIDIDSLQEFIDRKNKK